MFDEWVVIFHFLILLVQILHKHSEIGSFCVCFSFYTNTTRKLPTAMRPAGTIHRGSVTES